MEVNDSPSMQPAAPNPAVAGSTPSLNLADPQAGGHVSESVSSLPGGAPAKQPEAHASPFNDGGDAADLLFGEGGGAIKFAPGAAAAAAGGGAQVPGAAASKGSRPGGDDVRDVKLDGASAVAVDAKQLAAASAASVAAASAVHQAASHTHFAHGKRRFEVSVSDPEKKGENYLSQHMTYKINTTKETSPGKYSQSSVVRRYNDFQWLHQQLTVKYRGFLVPPIPDKQLIGNLESAFINERKRGLELFLTRIACHPELSVSPDVDVMLHGDDETLAKVKSGQIVTGGGPEHRPGQAPSPNAVAAGKKPGGAAGVWNLFKDAAQSVSNAVVGAKPREQTKDDVECERVRAYAEALEKSLTEVDAKASVLIGDRSKAIAQAWFDFGLACSLCGDFEANTGKEKDLGTCFAKLGSASDKLSVLLQSKKEAETVHCLELFRDYVRVVRQVQAMIAVRSRALSQYHQSLTTLEQLQAECGRLAANPNKKAQTAEKEKAVTAQQAIVDAEAADVKAVTATALAEAQRFRVEKLRDLKHVIADFVKTQIEHAKKVHSAWEAVLTDIDTL